MKSEGEILYNLLEDTKDNEIQWLAKKGVEKSNFDYFYCSITKIKKGTTIKLFFRIMDNYIEEGNMANYLCYVDIYMKKNDKKMQLLVRMKRDQMAIQELLTEVLARYKPSDEKENIIEKEISKKQIPTTDKYTKGTDIKKDQEIIYLSDGKKIKSITISDSEKLKVPFEHKSYDGYFTHRVFVIGTVASGRQNMKRIYWNSRSKIWIYNKEISILDKNKIVK